MAKKKLDNIDLEMIQCEKDGYGVHYGWWKATQERIAPPTEVTRICAFCGKPFVPKTPKQKYCDKVCSYSIFERRSNEYYQKRKSMRELGVNDGT